MTPNFTVFSLTTTTEICNLILPQMFFNIGTSSPTNSEKVSSIIAPIYKRFIDEFPITVIIPSDLRFSNDITNRTYSTKINKSLSPKRKVIFGVPQNSPSPYIIMYLPNPP